MPGQPAFDVFLAYNSQDMSQVRALVQELRRRNLRPWIDEEQVPPGQPFQDVIQLAIANVKAAIILIGSGGLGQWQIMELRSITQQAIEAHIPVIPVLLPDVGSIPDGLLFLKQFNWVKFNRNVAEVEALDRLEWGITGHKPNAQMEQQSDKTAPKPGTQVSRSISRQQLLKWGISAGVGIVGVTIGAHNGISYWTRSFSSQSPANPSLPPKLTTTPSPLNVQSFVEELENGVMLEMIKIPGGKFNMGSLPTEAGHGYEESPQHEATISGFALGKYPVTQAQWRAVAALPAVSRNLDPTPAYFQGINHPVEQISWLDAVEFCARLSKKTGRSYRLPTEAEWEYACRAGTSTPYYFGEILTQELANYNNSTTTPVGSFQANAFGLHDMHGNVWECCAVLKTSSLVLKRVNFSITLTDRLNRCS